MQRKTLQKNILIFLTIMAIGYPVTSFGAWALPGNYGLPVGHITDIIEGILNWLLVIIGLVSIIGFVIAGAKYILAMGDDKAVESAKNAMKNSIIGVVVALSGYVIIQAVVYMLNGYSTF